jgi:alpha-galactosidase
MSLLACWTQRRLGVGGCERGAEVNWGAMSQTSTTDLKSKPTATAVRLTGKLDSEGLPTRDCWDHASPIQFDHDWRGENADSSRSTEVRLLWTPETLFMRFHQRYRTITVFPDARPDGWRNELWDRDVAEAFLQPDPSDPLRYKEFEVSPNGFWIDLDISHGKLGELHSKLRRRVVQNSREKTWTAELAVPMLSLTQEFSPDATWRANFYRVEGEQEPRFYSAWSPTYSPKPNFHVPDAFGKLVFR